MGDMQSTEAVEASTSEVSSSLSLSTEDSWAMTRCILTPVQWKSIQTTRGGLDI